MDTPVLSYYCMHDVPNAQYGQFRLDSPTGPIITDFSDQVSNPVQRGLFRPVEDPETLLTRPFFAVIDESSSGARIAGQPTCWSGEQGNGDHALCVNDNRFRVDVYWRDFAGAAGPGIGSLVSDDSGLFWFFSPNDWELLVRVLDECATTDSFWVFAGGLTNVEVDITVTDTQTNAVRTYFNPLDTPFQPIQDTSVRTAEQK